MPRNQEELGFMYAMDGAGITPHGREGAGRYIIDHIDGPGKPGMHDTNLFDQEPEEIIDMATGRPYDNSTEVAINGLRTLRVNGRHGNTEDVLPALKDGTEDDAAARWLAEHDPSTK